jgi:hypothetical protein
MEGVPQDEEHPLEAVWQLGVLIPNIRLQDAEKCGEKPVVEESKHEKLLKVIENFGQHPYSEAGSWVNPDKEHKLDEGLNAHHHVEELDCELHLNVDGGLLVSLAGVDPDKQLESQVGWEAHDVVLIPEVREVVHDAGALDAHLDNLVEEE